MSNIERLNVEVERESIFLNEGKSKLQDSKLKKQGKEKGEMFAISITRAAPSLQRQALKEAKTNLNEARFPSRQTFLARDTQG